MGLTQAFPVLHSTAAIVPCTISLRFTKWTPEKGYLKTAAKNELCL